MNHTVHQCTSGGHIAKHQFLPGNPRVEILDVDTGVNLKNVIERKYRKYAKKTTHK